MEQERKTDILGAIDLLISVCSNADQRRGMYSVREMLSALDAGIWQKATEAEREEFVAKYLECRRRKRAA